MIACGRLSETAGGTHPQNPSRKKPHHLYPGGFHQLTVIPASSSPYLTFQWLHSLFLIYSFLLLPSFWMSFGLCLAADWWFFLNISFSDPTQDRVWSCWHGYCLTEISFVRKHPTNNQSQGHRLSLTQVSASRQAGRGRGTEVGLEAVSAHGWLNAFQIHSFWWSWKRIALLLCQAKGDTLRCNCQNCLSQPTRDLIRSYLEIVQRWGCWQTPGCVQGLHAFNHSVKSLRHVWLFATPRTAAYKAPLSMGFSR